MALVEIKDLKLEGKLKPHGTLSANFGNNYLSVETGMRELEI